MERPSAVGAPSIAIAVPVKHEETSSYIYEDMSNIPVLMLTASQSVGLIILMISEILNSSGSIIVAISVLYSLLILIMVIATFHYWYYRRISTILNSLIAVSIFYAWVNWFLRGCATFDTYSFSYFLPSLVSYLCSGGVLKQGKVYLVIHISSVITQFFLVQSGLPCPVINPSHFNSRLETLFTLSLPICLSHWCLQTNISSLKKRVIYLDKLLNTALDMSNSLSHFNVDDVLNPSAMYPKELEPLLHMAFNLRLCLPYLPNNLLDRNDPNDVISSECSKSSTCKSTTVLTPLNPLTNNRTSVSKEVLVEQAIENVLKGSWPGCRTPVNEKEKGEKEKPTFAALFEPSIRISPHRIKERRTNASIVDRDRTSSICPSNHRSSIVNTRLSRLSGLRDGLTNKVATILCLKLSGVQAMAAADMEVLLSDFSGVCYSVLQSHRACIHSLGSFRVVASWNASRPVSSHQVIACQASYKLTVVLREFLERWKRLCPHIQIGSAVGSGNMIVGNSGTPELRQFHLIAKEVEETMILSELSIHLKTPCIVTDVVYNEVQFRFQCRVVDYLVFSYVDSCPREVVIYEILRDCGETLSRGPQDEWMYQLQVVHTDDKRAVTTFCSAMEFMRRQEYRHALSAVTAYIKCLSNPDQCANRLMALLQHVNTNGPKSLPIPYHRPISNPWITFDGEREINSRTVSSTNTH